MTYQSKPFIMPDEEREGDYDPRRIAGRNRIGEAIDRAVENRGGRAAVAMSPTFGLPRQLKRSG